MNDNKRKMDVKERLIKKRSGWKENEEREKGLID